MFHGILYSSLSFLSAFLVLIPLPWFVQSRCIPALFAIAWLFVLDVLYGLSPLILGDGLPDTNGAHTYCDIATKLLIGLQTAIPATMLCFAFSFEDWLVRPRGGSSSSSDSDNTTQRRHLEHRRVFHVLFCLAAPLISMTLHVAVQGNRFDFVEKVGCIPAVSMSVLCWIFVWIVPAIPSCVTSIYLVFVVRYRPSDRGDRDRAIPSPSSEFSLSAAKDLPRTPQFSVFRIVRTAIMICVSILWTFALVIYALVVSAKSRELVFVSHPSLSVINSFSSLTGSPSTMEVQVLLLTGPFFSVVLFATSIDRDVLSSFGHAIFAPFQYLMRLRNRKTEFNVDWMLTDMPEKRGQRDSKDSDQLMYEIARIVYELEGRPINLTQPDVAYFPRPRSRIQEQMRWWHCENRSRRTTTQQRPRRGSREYEAAMWIYAQTRDPRPLSTIQEGSSIASTEDLRSLISTISNTTTSSKVREFLDKMPFPPTRS